MRFKAVRDREFVEGPLITEQEGRSVVDASALENNMFVNVENIVPLEEDGSLLVK